jgi:LacI family transcriptional regulator
LVLHEHASFLDISSDDIALGVLKGLRDLNLNVPQDIKVIGFDDVAFSKFYTPSLTTIAQDRLALGEMAAKHLIEMIEGSIVTLEKITRIPVKLVIRESTQ